MWFKQIQLFQLSTPIRFTTEKLAELFQPMLFKPCLPTLPSSMGWVSPLDEEGAPLVRTINGCMMICLQIEEKILPATVIRQEVQNKVKQIESKESRKIRQKEKLSLKDEMIHTLLPRAFSKFTRLYAYIDPKNNWIIFSAAHAAKAEQFSLLFERSTGEKICPLELKKVSPIITHWLRNQIQPELFSIEKNCMLQDPNQQNRVIRAQQQDLFAKSIQSFTQDGCEVKQLALNWQDRVHFVLSDDFSLRNIQFQEEIIAQANDMESETRQQQFDTDFMIMAGTFSQLLKDLLTLFGMPKKTTAVNPPVEARV